MLDGQHASKFMTVDTAQNITGAKTSIGKPWAVRMSQDTSNAVAGLVWKNTSGTGIADLTYHNTTKRIFINANIPEVTDIWDDTAGKYSLRIGWNELTYNSYPILRSDNYDDYTVTKTGRGASGTWGINISGNAASASSVAWGNIEGKPSTFTPSSHKHAAGDITSGTLSIARGGTGITSNPSLLVNLDSTSADSVFKASPRPGVTGTLDIAHGGTNATTAAQARTNLGITPANIGAATSSHTHNFIVSEYSGSGGVIAPGSVGMHRLWCKMMYLQPESSGGGYCDWLLMNAYIWSDVPYATAIGVSKTAIPRAFIMSGPNSTSKSSWVRKELATQEWVNNQGFIKTDADNNTTYRLGKSGSTITLTGSDGSKSYVIDSNTTYSNATTSAAGLMSAADKTKLNNTPTFSYSNGTLTITL